MPVISERSMYWDSNDIHWAGGHCSCGVNVPALTWYLAEGSTQGTFDEWVLIMNPNDAESQVKVTFMPEGGTNYEQSVVLSAKCRYTIHVNEIMPDMAVSTKVETTNGVGIIAERAMYWNVELEESVASQADNGHWFGGHCSQGVFE